MSSRFRPLSCTLASSALVCASLLTNAQVAAAQTARSDTAPRVESQAGQSTQQKANRLPAYIAFAVGGTATIAAVVSALLANEQRDGSERCIGRCTEDQISGGRSLALANTLLGGVAVIGVGVGITLLVIEPRETTNRTSLTPKLELSVAAASASARSTWAF